MRIFAFLGPARVGKTTAADMLDTQLCERGFHVERLSMAFAIKEGMRRVGITKEEQPEQYRSLAQRWGAGRRDRNPDHYVQKAYNKIERFRDLERADWAKLNFDGNLECWDETAVIIDDIRYPNEVNLMQDLDATIVWVDGTTRINFTEPFRQHESEEMANHLAHDSDALDEMLESTDGWVLDADNGVKAMADQLIMYVDRIWLGVWDVLGFDDSCEKLSRDVEDMLDELDEDDS